jgi:hypothetical protein
MLGYNETIMKWNISMSIFLSLVVAFTFVIMSGPLFVQAENHPHKVCVALKVKLKRPPVNEGVCEEKSFGIGSCYDVQCRAKSYKPSGGQPGGAADEGLKALKGLLDQVMKALMGGMGGGMPMPMGGGGGAPPPGGGMPPQMPNVLDQLKLPETSDKLLDELNKEKDEGSSGILDSVFGVLKGDDEDKDVTTATKTLTGTTTKDLTEISGGINGRTDGSVTGSIETSGPGVVVSGDDATTVSGERSEVRSSDNEATLEANVRDEEKNSEVGGFYGFTSRAIGQITVVERLCTSRPWANSFVSRIIPDTFFDGLCIKRGFSITSTGTSENRGVQSPANITEAEDRVKARIEERKKPNVGKGEPGILCEPEIARPGDDINLKFSCGSADLTGTSGFTVLEAGETRATVSAAATAQYGIACSDKKIYSCITQVFDPRVSIWADPANVPLGTRTTVFWTTEDVDGCVIKGPSFSETGPFGGASTVPINGLSKFSITCVAPDGGEIKGDTTVDLSI